MRVKKLLQVADNIRNDAEVEITATKVCMDADIATATKDLISQDISIQMDASEKVKFLSSITSLTIRLPAFDHICHNDKKYLKIKSNEFLFAKSSLTESS